VKLLWAYIRENGLQDPENRRKIICNDVLRILFNTDSTDMFKMNKLLSKHIWPLENGSTVVTCPDNAEPRPKKPKIEKSEAGHDGRGRSSGFLAPIPISEGLAKFLGAEDGKVSRADAVKRIWDYIKENNLQVGLTIPSPTMSYLSCLQNPVFICPDIESMISEFQSGSSRTHFPFTDDDRASVECPDLNSISLPLRLSRGLS
jgi:hypothetical protein